MRLLRFISQREYDALQRDGIVKQAITDRAWSGMKKLFTFPVGYHDIQDYVSVQEYLSVAYDIDYDYMITLEYNDHVHETFAAYDVEMFDMTLGRKSNFEIDEDSYEDPVYVIPEVRIDYYTKEQVVDIKQLKNGKIQEAHIPDEDIEVRGTENWLVNDILFVIYEEIKDIPFSFAKDWIIKMYKEHPKEDRHELYLSLMNNIDELYEITMALVRDYKAQSKGKV